ncbi:DNA-directed RNA polymerase i subunit rpa12 [Anaeramoeba ignava]|uniref:DNA-directed RNA polymerase subunit n=1 Tax=Anaeramoeba ignava TaxID=1746090 RepID=A0A9Q0LUS1_ANAIG|nr:DNA-directed RNA polymerase i subunit rpa12 [Anaeramoeba ignava]
MEPFFDFCPVCHNYLNYTSIQSNSIICDVCGYETDVIDLDGKTHQSIHHLEDEINFLSDEAEDLEEEKESRSLINELCPKCGHNKLLFNTAQLRSADEGQTIFYECPKCHYSWSQNS